VTRPIVLQRAAHADLTAALDYYVTEAGEGVALRFVQAFEDACRHIGAWPDTGSGRLGADLGLPSLRHWRIESFPYAVFYVAQTDHVDVWRILHLSSDIPAWMIEP
tara:strand:+ start:6245 stop:6562 length:318 start_codon:yes stop_codon:yes gene_type:complete